MIRLRRLRGSEAIRNMVRENRVNKEDLVYPECLWRRAQGSKNPVEFHARHISDIHSTHLRRRLTQSGGRRNQRGSPVRNTGSQR